jgi:hypothetical protein
MAEETKPAAGKQPDTLAANIPSENKVEVASGKPPPDERVAVTSTAHFYEHPDQSGKFLAPGDKVKVSRERAVELRANGLVTFDDETEEKKANEAQPMTTITDNTNPAITSRSFGTRGRR